MMPADRTPRPRVRWRIGRAAFYGFLLQLVAFVTSNLANGGKEIALWRTGTVAEQIGYFGGELAACPLIFMAIAAIHNWSLRRSSPPQS